MTTPRTTIQAQLGDITQLVVDAIVNAANQVIFCCYSESDLAIYRNVLATDRERSSDGTH
jgi:O-acetyl-ADP-ribose deacetylase (regulator of RNase III)